LSGLVERVTFHNEDSGFCVLRVKARGQRDLITVIGHAASISAGEFIQVSGQWVNDRTHGVQFRANFMRSAPPTTAEGIEKYLASGMIKGIGPIYAKKLVRAFSESVFNVIEQKPERLQEVDGIGPKRAESIVAAWADQKAIREIMIFLHSYGVGTSRAVRIFKTYGADAIRVISENPYRLARDIRGIGFKSADQIAGKLGIEKTAMIRARAGVGYALTEAMDEGHCGLPREQLLTMAATLLEVPAAIIEGALEMELQDAEVVTDTVDERPCIFLAGCIGPSVPSPVACERSCPVLCRGRRSMPRGPFPGSRAKRASPSPRANARRCAWHCDRRSWSSPAVPASARPRWSIRS
jgi:exodeoxyribonuclease V alpha subunit